MAATKSWSQLVDSKEPVVVMPPSVKDAVPSIANLPISLADIMSEQLAVQLSVEPVDEPIILLDVPLVLEEESVNDFGAGSSKTPKEWSGDFPASLDECTSDEVLARMLQHQWDLEHDRALKREEEVYNSNSKVRLSFENHRRLKNKDLEEGDEEEEEPYHEYGEESKDWDYFEERERTSVKIGQKGFTVSSNGKVTTKHDLEMSKARNACKVMDFQSDIKTGDGGGFPMRIPNNVFNVLKAHSRSEGKRMARLHEKKEKSQAEKVLDERSRILLFKLIDRGVLETMNGIIATGKESVVVHGLGQNEEKGIPMGEVAIKIFKTTITEFTNRIQYIVGDPILEQTGKLSRQNPKLTIPLWAEKEMHNLNRIGRAGINCPQVLLLKKHILIMSFIGREGRPAPTLKNLMGTTEMFDAIWEKVEDLMVRLYRDCQLIHADLSEYNLLWHEDKLWCIDVSQAVRITHPMAHRFLWRDCQNICKFFSRKLSEPKDASELFAQITGITVDMSDTDGSTFIEMLDKTGNYERKEANMKLVENDEDHFDELFARGLKDNENTTADDGCH